VLKGPFSEHHAILSQCLRHLRGAALIVNGGPLTLSAVHDVRTHLKRARASLWLLQGSIGKKPFRRLNASLRAFSSELAEARDLTTVSELVRRYARAAHLPGKTATQASARLRRAAHRATSKLDRAKCANKLRQIADRLAHARHQASALSYEHRIADCYAAARQAGRHAKDTPAGASMHQWRRKLQRLWHVLEIAEANGPKRARRLAARAKRLSKVLGSYHDTTLLADHLAKIDLSAVNVKRLRSVLRVQQTALARRAFVQGRRLFRLRPKKLRARLFETR